MFAQALITFNNQVSSLIESAQKSSSQADLEALEKFLISGSKQLRKDHKEAFTEQLKKHKILPKLEFISFLVNEELATRVDKYDVDEKAGFIKVIFKDPKIDPIKSKISDLDALIEMLLGIPKEHPLYFVMLGYFSTKENYKFIQLYNSLT